MRESLTRAISLAERQTLRIFFSLDKRMGEAGRTGQVQIGGGMQDVKHTSAGVPPEKGSHQLRRGLTLREAVALGVGGTIGGGIFVLVGAAAGRAGPGTLLSFALAFGMSLLIALPCPDLACPYPLPAVDSPSPGQWLVPNCASLLAWAN